MNTSITSTKGIQPPRLAALELQLARLNKRRLALEERWLAAYDRYYVTRSKHAWRGYNRLLGRLVRLDHLIAAYRGLAVTPQ